MKKLWVIFLILVSVSGYAIDFDDFEPDKYLFGIIDIHGKEILPCEYYSIKVLSDDYFMVAKEKDVWGVVNAKGKEILPKKYKNIECSNDRFLAENEQGEFLFDKKGKLISELKDITNIEFVGNKFIGEKAGKYYIFDEKVNPVSKAYDYILNPREILEDKVSDFEMGEEYLLFMNIK